MLTYAEENWPANRSDKRKIKSAEIRFVRPGSGCTLLDQKQNTDLRSQL
jgi:hypothetical protein